jgi:putative membrane protein
MQEQTGQESFRYVYRHFLIAEISMNLSYLLAALHILTFGIGFYAIWSRANAFKKLREVSGLNTVFKADNLWGVAALLWIATGLWRAFGGLEKGSHYYLHSNTFIAKMVLFLLVVIIEIKPMVTLIQWRIRKRKSEPMDLSSARLLARLSHIELGLLVIIVFLATAMARGIGY